MSTPTSLQLPDGTRRATVMTARGEFAVLDAMPAAGACELGTALLVPGYTGSKEDFLSILGELAAAGRRIIAVDQRGQYQTHGPDDADAYEPQQREMAARLGAERTCIPGAAHSPNVEAPATTAHALTEFWNSTERLLSRDASRLQLGQGVPGATRCGGRPALRATALVVAPPAA